MSQMKYSLSSWLTKMCRQQSLVIFCHFVPNQIFVQKTQAENLVVVVAVTVSDKAPGKYEQYLQ